MPVTIRSSLLSLMLAVMVPGVLGGGVWYIGATFQAERQAHERTLRETARALSTVVDTELAARSAVARVLAQSLWLDAAPDMTCEDLERFKQLSKRALAGLDGWVELRTNDQTVFDSRLQPGTATRPATAAAPASSPPLQQGFTAAVSATMPAPEISSEGSPRVLPLHAGSAPEHTYAAVVQPVTGRTSCWPP